MSESESESNSYPYLEDFGYEDGSDTESESTLDSYEYDSDSESDYGERVYKVKPPKYHSLNYTYRNRAFRRMEEEMAWYEGRAAEQEKEQKFKRYILLNSEDFKWYYLEDIAKIIISKFVNI
jgi:hypothetical protein